jgi:hypothetical protein
MLTSRVFPKQFKPATVCRILAIAKGANCRGIRRIKAKHAKRSSNCKSSIPSDAMMFNARHYKLGQGLARFE